MTHKEISTQTRTELANALRSKMELKPFKTISVRELTRDCCMDRHTFYYHFRDIYGLMEWMFQQDKQRLTEQLSGLQSWGEGLTVLLKYLRENRASCLCAIGSIHSEYFDRMLFDVVYGLQTDVLKNGETEATDRFYTAVYVSIFKSYLREEFPMPDEELIERLEIMQRALHRRK